MPLEIQLKFGPQILRKINSVFFCMVVSDADWEEVVRKWFHVLVMAKP